MVLHYPYYKFFIPSVAASRIHITKNSGYPGMAVNIDSRNKVTPPVIMNQRKPVPSVIIKIVTSLGNNDYFKNFYKVMHSQNLLVNNDSPETIRVKFEH